MPSFHCGRRRPDSPTSGGCFPSIPGTTGPLPETGVGAASRDLRYPARILRPRWASICLPLAPSSSIPARVQGGPRAWSPGPLCSSLMQGALQVLLQPPPRPHISLQGKVEEGFVLLRESRGPPDTEAWSGRWSLPLNRAEAPGMRLDHPWGRSI